MRHRTVAGLIATGMAAMLLLGPAVTSSAASTFTATAGGEVARSVLRFSPAILQEDLLDPGALAAQASLTSFGESTAFASHPYPGSVPVSLPGTVNGLLGPSLPAEAAGVLHVPEYPLYATSSHPATPSASVHAGAWELRAESRQAESQGIATDGVNRTEARITVDGDVVKAGASAELGSFGAAPALQVSGVRSSATVERAPGGALRRSADFSVAGIIILGQQVRWSSAGLELVGLRAPVAPASGLDPVEALLSALEAQGTSIRFLEETETTDGIISAGIEVSRVGEVPDVGTVTEVTTLGRTFASVSNTARPTASSQAPAGLGQGGAFSSGSTGSPSPTGVVAPSAPSPTGGADAAGPAATSETAKALPVRSLTPERIDAGRFYPVLLLAAAMLVSSFNLFRRLGGSLVWSS